MCPAAVPARSVLFCRCPTAEPSTAGSASAPYGIAFQSKQCSSIIGEVSRRRLSKCALCLKCEHTEARMTQLRGGLRIGKSGCALRFIQLKYPLPLEFFIVSDSPSPIYERSCLYSLTHTTTCHDVLRRPRRFFWSSSNSETTRAHGLDLLVYTYIIFVPSATTLATLQHASQTTNYLRVFASIYFVTTY